jgi:hypothetical protein
LHPLPPPTATAIEQTDVFEMGNVLSTDVSDYIEYTSNKVVETDV